MIPPAASIDCRPIAQGDLGAVAALLAEGFPERSRTYWDRALAVLRDRSAPPGYPRYGMLLEAAGRCVGVLLQIYTLVRDEGPTAVRCNNSSWYVAPAYRTHAAMLVSRAVRHPEVTYTNVSPARPTWPILKVQGYRRYSEGQVAALPWLSLRGSGARVRDYASGRGDLPPDRAALLDRQVELGMIVAVCRLGGRTAAFGFLPRRVHGLPVAQLVWCEDTADFLRVAGPLGRWLLRRGYLATLLDACRPEPGLVGRFFKDRAPKYYRGGRPPRLNDLADTEAVLFGA